jgi:hypothetical protein
MSPRIFFRFLLTAVVLSIAGCAQAQSPPLTAHDRAFWRAVIADNYQVPAGQPVLPLAMELAGFVGATDSELRDSFGYEILANWIHRSGQLSPRDLDALRGVFLPHVAKGIGESETDTIFLRSFALLNLKELAAADLRTPFLTEASFDELFELTVKVFAGEKDARGYVADKGWAHATAHGADMLRILARNSKLKGAQQSRMIDAIAERTRTAKRVYAWGEDARIAAALGAVASRADADIAAFDSWFAALRADHVQLWRSSFDSAAYVRVRAQANTLTQLAALLARQNNAAFPAKLLEALHAALAAVN